MHFLGVDHFQTLVPGATASSPSSVFHGLCLAAGNCSSRLSLMAGRCANVVSHPLHSVDNKSSPQRELRWRRTGWIDPLDYRRPVRAFRVVLHVALDSTA